MLKELDEEAEGVSELMLEAVDDAGGDAENVLKKIVALDE